MFSRPAQFGGARRARHRNDPTADRDGMDMTQHRLRIAVVGAGYWGPNLARNFSTSPDWDLVAICDLDRERAERVADQVGRVPAVT